MAILVPETYRQTETRPKESAHDGLKALKATLDDEQLKDVC